MTASCRRRWKPSPMPRRRRADHRGDQQDRQGRRQSHPGEDRIAAARNPGRRHGRRDPGGRSFRHQGHQSRQAGRSDPAAGRNSRSQGQSRPRRRRRGDRGQARQGPRPGRHRAGAARHAESRRHRRGRLRMGPGAPAANDRGETVQSAGPSTPVEVLGLSARAGSGRRNGRGGIRSARPRSGGISRPQAPRSAPGHQSRARRWINCSRPAKPARSACCRWCSRPTCRVRRKRSRARWPSSAPTKSARRSCSPASAASPKAT